MSAMTDLMIENRDQRLTELQREMHALRMENDRLRTELERAVNMETTGALVREIQRLRTTRPWPSEEAIMYAKRTFDPNVTTWSHDLTRTMAADILRMAGIKVPFIAEGTETKQ